MTWNAHLLPPCLRGFMMVCVQYTLQCAAPSASLKKQLELPPYCPTLTKPAPPPPLPLPACVCVHDCGCVYEEAWQWKELRLSSGSLREWLQSRSRSLQIIIHVSVWASEGEGELRLSSVYSELAGGRGRPWSNTSHTCHSNITKEVL